MAAKTVVVGCKLPNGIVLEHPLDAKNKVELAGRNKAVVIGADYATTEVDGDFWDNWIAFNKEFTAVTSGAIFVAKTISDAAAIARELINEKTGLEPMGTDGKDERAGGIKTEKEA